MVSIDIGTYYIKIVSGKGNKNGVSIDTMNMVETSPGSYSDGQIIDINKMKDSIEEVLKREKIKAKSAICTLESTSVIMRELEVPVIKKKEMMEMIKLEVQQYLPVDLKEYIIQYKKIKEFDDNGNKKARILTVAMPKIIVNNYNQLLKMLRLKPMALDINSNALDKLFDEKTIINESFNFENKTVALMDIGYSYIHIVILHNGVFQFNRLLNLGAKDIDSNIANSFNLTLEEAMKKKEEIESLNEVSNETISSHIMMNDIIKSTIDSWIGDIERLFKYYTSKKVGNKIDKIFIHGQTSKFEGMDKYLEELLDISVSKIKSLNNVDISKTDNKNLTSYINAIGAMIRR